MIIGSDEATKSSKSKTAYTTDYLETHSVYTIENTLIWANMGSGKNWSHIQKCSLVSFS